MQLKSSIDQRTADLVGLAHTTSIKDFRELIDEEFQEYKVAGQRRPKIPADDEDEDQHTPQQLKGP
jgi:hypothetical protein